MMQTLFLLSIVFLAFFYFRCGKKMPDQTSNTNRLENGFLIKNDTLFFYEKALDQVDVSSFTIIDETYARDKFHVYYYTTERPSKDYFTTKKLVFEIVEIALPNEFSVLNFGYGKDNQQAYRNGSAFQVRDAQSLEAVNLHWVKDKKAVYLDGKEVPEIDGSSFELLSTSYARDKKQVFYLEGIHDGHPRITPFCLTPSSFEMLDFPYTKDNTSVYFRDIKMEARPQHFQVLGSGYSKDDVHLFFQDQKMKVKDLTSFSLYKENENFTGEGAYARDKFQVYYQHGIIEHAHPGSLLVLNEVYSKDQQFVYFKTKKINGADPSTFIVFPHDMGDSDAKDKYRHYHQGQRVSNIE